MSSSPGYHNREAVIIRKICSLIHFLNPTTYNEIATKIEYWIEYGFTEHSTTVDELVEQVSLVPWAPHSSHASVVRFLKEFRDAPHRSKQAKSFVDKLCPHVLRWFAAASAEDLEPGNRIVVYYEVVMGGWEGFVRAASFVGHLVEWDLLSHELVRRHLVKPLIAHHYIDPEPDISNVTQVDARCVSKYKRVSVHDSGKAARVNAIYQLFLVAGNTLLQGLLEPEDVQACFRALDTKLSLAGAVELDPSKLNELREFRAAWLKRKEDEENGEAVANVLVEAETPVASISKNLPVATIGIDVPSSALGALGSPSVSHSVEYPPKTCFNIPATAISSPTLTVSTVSDLTPTELWEEQAATRHRTFYFEDGNVEIVCGDTVFRVHSTVISFSSSKLRDILSPSALLNTPMPEGRPQIAVSDSAEDFAVLLKVIYTPGFPARHKVPEFSVFVSLLQMATKYSLSDVREQLVEDLKGAYPTKWEDFEAANILGEDVFGSPKPHPNAVLSLFLEQNVKFALPFAAYRAGLGGPSALVNDGPGTIIPSLTLVSVTHGIGEMRGMMILAAYSVVYMGGLEVCVEMECTLSVDTNHIESRMEALEKVFHVIAGRSEGDMLSSLSLGTLVCVDCATLLEKAHLDYRKELVWAALPSLLSWEGWEGV